MLVSAIHQHESATGVHMPNSFPGSSVIKESACNAGVCLQSWTWFWSLDWEDPLENKGQLTPVFLPGKSQGQRSLVGYNPWGCKRVRHNLVTKQRQNHWWTQMQKFSTEYYQSVSNSTLKRSYMTIKWDSSQGCKASTNQSMRHSTSAN